MKRIIITVILAMLVCLTAFAQNMRSVRGLVADENGKAMPSVTLKADGCPDVFTTDRQGRFDIKVPVGSRNVTASCEGYSSTTADLTGGGFVIIRLLKAGQAPSATSTTSTTSATAAAATTAATVPAARPAQTPEPRKSGKASRGQTSAKKPKPANDFPVVARDSSKYLEKGFYNCFEASYAYSFNQGCVVHTNAGERIYSTMHPVELAYNAGYKFSRLFTLYAGFGFSYNVRYVDWCDTVDPALYPDFKSQRWDIPVHIGARLSFCKGAVRPFILLQGGLYVMALVPDFEAGLGLSILTGRRSAVNIGFTARNVTWPHFSTTQYYGCPLTVAPAVKIGFNF